ncbi:DUF421 domain-containing protein [Halalkalibacterium halodurans]|jgi:uncharacterized membrane protein YcaP (DUF421 family)|uniref:DUF421 domain-containing protein n=1 Tax=Halalkalibacterium halodurans TaxID=86665 RepID=UPI002E1E85FC|nr:DUF421 domain-containing protein [Halalkalibacterium halodurans]
MTDLGNVLIRGAVGFLVLLVLARIMGKKHITDMTYYEYIVGIAIGSIAAELTFSPHVRMSNFLFGMIIWAIFPMVLSKLELKSFRFRSLAEGEPTVLIENGKILEENLKKENLTVDELMIHLRQKDAFKLDDVESAVMEKSGLISVMKKSNVQPLTPKDAGLVIELDHSPQIVMIDGNVLEKSLQDYGYTKEWLLAEVTKQGAKRFEDVFLAQIDSKGNVYVDLYNDQQSNMPEVKQKLLMAANIKQLQADLIQISMQVTDAKTKEQFKAHAKQMDQLFHELSAHMVETPST